MYRHTDTSNQSGLPDSLLVDRSCDRFAEVCVQWRYAPVVRFLTLFPIKQTRSRQDVELAALPVPDPPRTDDDHSVGEVEIKRLVERIARRQHHRYKPGFLEQFGELHDH